MAKERKYSSFGRPFRLQLTAASAAGFDAPASLGQCQNEPCERWEWCKGARFCRDCWLLVYGQDHLPDRQGKV